MAQARQVMYTKEKPEKRGTKMETISRKLLGAEKKLTERVLQIGEGRFLRAFADRMINDMNKALDTDWGVCVVQPRNGHGIDALNAQEGLFTVWLRGVDEQGAVDRLEPVTCVTRGLSPYRDFEALLQAAVNPALSVIISNTTEAGIVYRAEDQLTDTPPESYPGKLTRLLWERYQTLGEAGGLILLPCELIEDNGDTLKACVLRHAAAWKLGEGFAAWIEEKNIFANTLVDQIVTGYPDEAETEAAFARLGYADPLLAAAEPFALWVIEGPKELSERLPLAQAGCPVVFTDDLSAYRRRKVALLNGPHTAMTAVGLTAGLETVGECVGDPQLRPYIEKLLAEEIMPALELTGEGEFAAEVMRRFENPHNRHLLKNIAMNSVSKVGARLLPALEGCRRKGIEPRRILLALACLMELLGDPACDISEDPTLRAAFVQGEETLQAYVSRVLSDTRLWGKELSWAAEAVETLLTAVREKGVRAVLEAM